MSYLLKSSSHEDRRKNTQKKVAITFLVIVIVMVVIVSSPVKGVLFFVAEPIWKLENSILNSSLFEYFKYKQTLINEKQDFEQKLLTTSDLSVLNDTLKNENETLKDLLGRKEITQNTILAAVLVRPPQIPYDSIIIDVGANSNVKIGDKVIANANVYLGEVSEVNYNSAKVILYSTPGQKLSVIISESSVTAEAVGIGGGNFSIFLPSEVQIKEGDVIVIPAITPNVFGIIEKVNFKDKDSFQTVLFKSPVNISELRFVQVIIN